MSRQKKELRIENKTSSLGKTVLQLWSQICEKMAKWVHKMTLTLKKFKQQNNQKAENMKCNVFFLHINILDKLSNIWPNQNPLAKQFFFKLYFFVFSS